MKKIINFILFFLLLFFIASCDMINKKSENFVDAKVSFILDGGIFDNNILQNEVKKDIYSYSLKTNPAEDLLYPGENVESINYRIDPFKIIDGKEHYLSHYAEIYKDEKGNEIIDQKPFSFEKKRIKGEALGRIKVTEDIKLKAIYNQTPGPAKLIDILKRNNINLSTPSLSKIKNGEKIAVNILVLPIKFLDTTNDFEFKNSLDIALNGTVNPGYESVKSYYEKVSRGKLLLNFTIIDPQKSTLTVAEMEEYKKSPSSLPEQKVIADLLGNAFKENISDIKNIMDNKDFDQDGDGFIDGIFAVYDKMIGGLNDDASLEQLANGLDLNKFNDQKALTWFSYSLRNISAQSEYKTTNGKKYKLLNYTWTSSRFLDMPIEYNYKIENIKAKDFTELSFLPNQEQILIPELNMKYLPTGKYQNYLKEKITQIINSSNEINTAIDLKIEKEALEKATAEINQKVADDLLLSPPITYTQAEIAEMIKRRKDEIKNDLINEGKPALYKSELIEKTLTILKSKTPILNQDIKFNTSMYIYELGHLLGSPFYFLLKAKNANKTSMLGKTDMLEFFKGNFNPFTKVIFNWETPLIYQNEALKEYKLISDNNNDIANENEHRILIIPINNKKFTSFFNEYFIIDYYTPNGLNKFQAEGLNLFNENGVRIYHVNTKIKDELSIEILNITQFLYEKGYGDSGKIINLLESSANTIKDGNATLDKTLFKEGMKFENLTLDDGSILNIELEFKNFTDTSCTVIIKQK